MSFLIFRYRFLGFAKIWSKVKKGFKPTLILQSLKILLIGSVTPLTECTELPHNRHNRGTTLRVTYNPTYSWLQAILGILPIFNTQHFQHSAFQHSAFSTIRIFNTTHFQHHAFSTLRTPGLRTYSCKPISGTCTCNNKIVVKL